MEIQIFSIQLEIESLWAWREPKLQQLHTRK
jgi:hypothetical protein